MPDTNGNNKKTLLSILVQGGMASIALASLWIVWNIVTNHLSDNTAVLTKLQASVEQNNKIMEGNSEAVKNLQKMVEIFMVKIK